jgi:hypothetical protein
MFTLVFEGDIRNFNGNPFKTETPFGIPLAAGHGDALAKIDDLERRLEEVISGEDPVILDPVRSQAIGIKGKY